MKCIHCGQEIDPASRFCFFCGGNQAVAPAAPAKNAVDVRWIIGFVWLGLAIIGWILALVLMPIKANPVEIPREENQTLTYTLTEGTWYQWDPDSSELYSWTFDQNGTATCGIAGEKKSDTIAYYADGQGNVHIGDRAALWEYDALNQCYWLYTQNGDRICKTRIFCAASVPAGTAACYTYRMDNGRADIQISFAPVTELDTATASIILGWYNHYGCFGVCTDWENVAAEEAENVLLNAGYSREDVNLYGVKRICCCNTIAQSRAHAEHYLDKSMLPGGNVWMETAAECNGRLYMIVPPMGYEGYYVDGEVTDHGDGTWSAPVKYFDESTEYTAHFAMIEGTIKLIAIQKAQNSQGRAVLTEDTAWNLINRTDVGWLLYYFMPEGNVDNIDVYTFIPAGDSVFHVDCPSVVGIDTPEQLYAMLRRHYTERYADRFMQVSHVDDQRGNVYVGSWFVRNGTLYFEPNWGVGTQMLFRETMVIVQTGENSWTVTMEMEFTDERAQFHIVCENGTFKLDI